MRWRDVNRAGAAAAAYSFFHVEAIAIDRNGNEPGTGHSESLLRAGIAGFFDPDGVVQIEQCAGGNLQAQLRAGDDDYLRSVAANGARCAEIFGDGFAEWRVAHGIAVGHHFARGISRVAREERGPDADGKMVESGEADAEGADVFQVRIALHRHEVTGALGNFARDFF